MTGTSSDPNPPPQLPCRQTRRFTPAGSTTHGFYGGALPQAEVQAVLAEDVRGLDRELDGLRALQRGLLDLFLEASAPGRPRDPGEVELAARLADACTLAASRLAALAEAARQLEAGAAANQKLEDFLAFMGYDESDPTGGLAGADLETGAVEVRAVLRRTLALAENALRARQARPYLRLADVYGLGCYRLLRLLKAAGSHHTLTEAELREELSLGLNAVLLELKAKPSSAAPPTPLPLLGLTIDTNKGGMW